LPNLQTDASKTIGDDRTTKDLSPKSSRLKT
jgi:hypothetical protein